MRIVAPSRPISSAATAPCELKTKGEGVKLAKYVRCRGSVMTIHSTPAGVSSHSRLCRAQQPSSVNIVRVPQTEMQNAIRRYRHSREKVQAWRGFGTLNAEPGGAVAGPAGCSRQMVADCLMLTPRKGTGLCNAFWRSS